MYRFCASLLSVLALSGFSYGPVPPPADGPVAVSIIDRDGEGDLDQYPHRGQRWVAGSPGHRYSVQLRNRTGERVLVVLSVDGVNAISGQTASPDQSGYVLEPWQSSEITGWRKSNAEVAQFVFTDHGDSYASRTGRPANVGVVGIAVFEEARARVYDDYRPMPAPRPMPRGIASEASADKAAAAEASAAMPSARSPSANRQQLGTGHGAREWSQSSLTHFERASRTPVQVSQIRYDARSRLVAMGVLPRYRGGNATAPQAFPGGFVPDPPARGR
ncbi:hypothetical protein ATCM_01275 [Stenotrophomonas sp. ATCM1_4]|uniref:hypothetical protein n=1 Tax=Stenotrophomonas sp. ATCM1_4 TaxID=2259330 RepID=UPI00105256AF|nr:hypothetical protein [Stenotrophomonas sp. ATCM1_4]TDB26410.1 hypothetical protein ATCM_01275 [Stenotrophomonas sp. ATCM1_4]